MKISLIRHGRTTARQAPRIRATTFAAWLSEYDQAGIDPTLPPPDSLTRSLATCALLITSPTRRAIESATALGVAAERRVVFEAREAPLPSRIVWPLSHRPRTFVVVARILWLLGLARAEESKKQVVLRAQHLASQLSSLAFDFGHVALVGHGYMNIFLRKQLEGAGWGSSDSRSHSHWSCSHLEKSKPNQSVQRNAGSRPTSGDSTASETPSSLGPRG